MRTLTDTEQEVSDKIFELQLFVNGKLRTGKLPDINKAQLLIDDIQLLRHIWTKNEGTI